MAKIRITQLQEARLIETIIEDNKLKVVYDILKGYVPYSTLVKDGNDHKRIGLAIELDDKRQPITDAIYDRKQLFQRLEANEKCRNMFTSEKERQEIINKAIDYWYDHKQL